jgi:carotenoid cleavage dioxygenase-like enzyme
MATARRLTVKPGNSKIHQRGLAEGNLELPRIDYEAVNAKNYRYAYGVGARDPRTSGFTDQISKLDIKRSEQIHWNDREAYPGEPVFVRRPGSHGEDDGVLLSVVLDAARRTSYLLVLDARDMSELARAAVPYHIPFGFHGLHAARG